MTSSPSKKPAKNAAKKTPRSRQTSPKRGTAGTAGKGSGRKGKYNAAGLRIDGIFFHSKAEGERYEQLKELLASGAIDGLRLQPPFDCTVNNRKVCVYKADFQYDVIDDRGSVIRTVIEDVKGMITDIYKIKKKLVEAVYDVKILEIPSKKVGEWKDRTG
jgi:hypothetical protein